MKEHVDDRLSIFKIASVHGSAYRGWTSGINDQLYQNYGP